LAGAAVSAQPEMQEVIAQFCSKCQLTRGERGHNLGGFEQVISRNAFQPQPFCDVISSIPPLCSMMTPVLIYWELLPFT